VQERAANTLELIGKGNDFLNRSQKAKHLREKNYKWDYEIKNLLNSRRNGHQIEVAAHTEGETSNKGLITRINRELKILNSPKINEEMLNIPGHKGNENQRHFKILLHSC
jgi:hypothetical protein